MEAEGSLERDGVEDRPMSVMACLKRCREHPERIPAMAVRARTSRHWKMTCLNSVNLLAQIGTVLMLY